jgi:hypothetical protein
MAKNTYKELLEKESLLSDNDILDIVLEKEQESLEAVEDCFDGLINPVIMKGPPGTGKTEGIKILSQQMGVQSTDLIATEWTENPKDEPTYPYTSGPHKKVDGALVRGADYAPWALAADLYGNKDSGALVLDDNDDILKDTIAVSMLMDATEQSAKKTVKYVKANTTHELKMMGVETTFEVNTPIIILSNIDMKLHVDYQQEKENNGGRPANAYIKRWAALMSRGTYVDLQMNTPRSVRVFCEEKIRKVNMLTDSEWLETKFGRSLKKNEAEDVMKWVRFNQSSLALPLDLRTYNKVAGIMLKRKDWEKSAKARLLRVV